MRHCISLALGATMLLTTTAFGQDSGPVATGGVGGTLGRPLDEGVEDADPLAMSLRSLEVDLRDPVAFAQVYAVPDRDEMYMRADGGLFAVFPRSVYRNNGDVPVPNDTVFHIGLGSLLGSDWWMPESSPTQYPGRINARAFRDPTAFASEAGMPRASRPTGQPPTIELPWQTRHLGADARSPVRARELEPILSADRIAALMRRAADAESSRAAQAARGSSSSSSK